MWAPSSEANSATDRTWYVPMSPKATVGTKICTHLAWDYPYLVRSFDSVVKNANQSINQTSVFRSNQSRVKLTCRPARNCTRDGTCQCVPPTSPNTLGASGWMVHASVHVLCLSSEELINRWRASVISQIRTWMLQLCRVINIFDYTARP
jgi:hypothetical protein